jgi:hypothetical protein
VDAIIVLLNENSKICPWVRCNFDELLDWFVASDVFDDGCLFNFVYQIASIAHRLVLSLATVSINCDVNMTSECCLGGRFQWVSTCRVCRTSTSRQPKQLEPAPIYGYDALNTRLVRVRNLLSLLPDAGLT